MSHQYRKAPRIEPKVSGEEYFIRWYGSVEQITHLEKVFAQSYNEHNLKTKNRTR